MYSILEFYKEKVLRYIKFFKTEIKGSDGLKIIGRIINGYKL